MSSGFSYPQPTFQSPIYNPAFYLTLDANGYLTYEYSQTLYLSKNDYRLTYLTGITQGIATPGVALVPGSGGDISGIGALSCSSLTVNGSAIASAPSYVIGISPGTADLNKALVLDSSKNISGISSLSASSLTGTLQTAAQPNITSLGMLTGLTIDGSLSFSGASRAITGLSSLSATNLTGTLQTAAQPNITSLGTLTGLTIDGSLSFSGASRSITGLSSLSASSIAGTIQTASQPNITSLGTLTGLTIDGNLSFSGSSRAITGLDSLSLSGDAVITVPPASTITSSSPASAYPLQFRNVSNVSGASCGISFAIHEEANLSNYTANAAIVVSTDRTQASNNHAPGVFSILARSYQIQTDGSLEERMRIDANGKFSFSSVIGDGHWNFLRGNGNDGTIRFGTALSNKNCISLVWNYISSASASNYLGFSIYGTSNALTIQASDRVGVRTATNTTCFDVVGDSALLDGTYQRIAQFRNNNASPIGLEIQVSNAAAGSGAVWMGTQSTDALRLGVNNNTVMYLNSSTRVGINNTGPEATLHIGGMSWANSGFHSKQDGSASPALSWRSIQLTSYMGIGLYQTNTASIRLGTCDASFAWNGYATVYGGSYTNASDRDYKKDIEDISYGLDTVLQMRPREFTWKQDDRRSLGFVAQELLQVCAIPVSGDPNRPINPETGMPNDGMGVDLGSLTAVLCRAIQELKAELDELRAIISE